jgi:hypothetical protein
MSKEIKTTKMKKLILNIIFVFGLTFMMSSCYTYSFSVGQGAQGNKEIKKMNHYLIFGLAPVGVSDPSEMADGAKDYDVTITHTFVDGLLNAITGGIYTPTTTIVRK